MKLVGRALATAMVAESIICVISMLWSGFIWHYDILRLFLWLGLPFFLLLAGVLQWFKPLAALVVVVVLFPWASVVVHIHMLPVWPLLSMLPPAYMTPALVIENASVVLFSMLVWLSTRKGIHNQASQPIAGKPGSG